jgi:tetratricopeptide (TPR) repeat protein
MHRNWKTPTLSFHTRLKPRLFFVGLLLLIPGILFASLRPISTNEQSINVSSFYETTEIAENIWVELTNRFIMLYEMGSYPAAKSTAQNAYDIARNNFGLNNVNTADALLKLGIINQSMGNLIEAEDQLLGSLVILEAQLSPDHPDIAVVMTNLGSVYFELHYFEASEKYHQRALQIRKNALGADDPSAAQSIYNLAVLYENQNKLEQASALYQQAISSWSASLGPLHPYVDNALGNLSGIYSQQGKHQKAALILQRTVALKKSVFGDLHKEVAQSLISLGSTYLEQGQYQPASNAYEEALGIAQHVLRSSDPQLALLMYTLANIYHTQARIEERHTVRNTQQNIRQQADNGTTLMQQAISTDSSSQHALFEQALPLYQKAAEILDDAESDNHSALDVVLSELAMLYKEIGNTDMARATESRITTH